MSHRTLFVFIVICSLFFGGFSAFAAEVPVGVFQMSDGASLPPVSGSASSVLQVIQASASSTKEIPSTTHQTVAPLPLLLAIQSAQALLKAQPVEFDLNSGTSLSHVGRMQAESRRVTNDSGWRRVTLALWTPTTTMDASAMQFRMMTLEKNGTRLRAVQEPLAGIRVARSNGVNSEFVGLGNEVVVALRYPLLRERKISQRTTVFDVTHAVYTPYSRALHTPEMVMEGKRWFGELLTRVFAQLREDRVPSRAFPDKLLEEVISPEFVEAVSLIEHLDDRAFERDPARQIEAFYVTLAANQHSAYQFSRSKAGALGLVQFMPKTYAALARWPALRLVSNFEEGMKNPENAIRAQIAYLDYLLSRLPQEAREAYAVRRAAAYEYMAAAYNGGATRVAKAMRAWEENLDSTERLRVQKRSRLKRETMKYVLKLRRVLVLESTQRE